MSQRMVFQIVLMVVVPLASLLYVSLVTLMTESAIRRSGMSVIRLRIFIFVLCLQVGESFWETSLVVSVGALQDTRKSLRGICVEAEAF